jgi:hypothetical protein
MGLAAVLPRRRPGGMAERSQPGSRKPCVSSFRPPSPSVTWRYWASLGRTVVLLLHLGGGEAQCPEAALEPRGILRSGG